MCVNILSKLASNKDIVGLALGKIGYRLFDIANRLDQNHFDIDCIINLVFKNDTKFMMQVSELLDLTSLCKDLNAISYRFKNIINRNNFSKLIFNERFGLRAYKDRSLANTIRKTRKFESIKIRYKQTQKSFSDFVRYGKSYSDDVKATERKHLRFQELGCTLTDAKIKSVLEKYKDITNDNVSGYKKVTLTDVSALIAQLNNFQIENSKIVNFNYFNLKNIEYVIRLYPLHFLNTKVDITALESLFDDFVVVLPTVRLVQDAPYFIEDKISFDKEEDALRYIDNHLISNGVIPVLLGERDNKFYFLSYWSENGLRQTL